MKAKSQSRLMLELLRSGPKLTGELNAAGIGRPNSRAAQLRDQGHVIVCEHVDGSGGGSSYRYRLVLDALRDERPLPPMLQEHSPATSPAARDEQGELTVPAGASASAGTTVEHEPTCASSIVAAAACDCLAGLALEETPDRTETPCGGVSSSASTGCDALDLCEQLRLGDEAELLAAFGGGAS